MAKPVKRLERIHFLVHGFCYAGITQGTLPPARAAELEPYIARERRAAALWTAGVQACGATDALAVIPWPGCPDATATAFYDTARSALGDRCFILDGPDCMEPAFWTGLDADGRAAVLRELEAALVGQQTRWNKEELLTDLHCVACHRQLMALLPEHGYAYDPATVAATAWGASFDGCVTKYSLTLRRLLGLANPIEIPFERTVPDARFLLDATLTECLLLDNGLRVFLFCAGPQQLAMFTRTTHALADSPARVRLPLPPDGGVTVRSKQGLRLWPEREPYVLANVPGGFHEPTQDLVTGEANALRVPVSAGFVYRLAKAPVYIFAPPEMSRGEFRARLLAAERVEG